jgi:hypothetical protein
VIALGTDRVNDIFVEDLIRKGAGASVDVLLDAL